MKTEKCRSCGEKIMFATTESGKIMPVNKMPDENGNLVLEGDTVRYVGRPDEAPTLFEVEPVRYTSHFVSCPDRRAWRKR